MYNACFLFSSTSDMYMVIAVAKGEVLKFQLLA